MIEPPLDPKELARPEAFPGDERAVELRETHASWAFLGARDVYKVKKPVVFPFLDYGTVEARRAACDAEVALNRRLAPSTYLGVAPVRRGDDGRASFAGDGPIVDWAVHMLRLPDEDRADVLLAAGALDFAHVDAAAVAIARFHAGARTGDAVAAWGQPSAIARNVRENFDSTAADVERFVTAKEAREIERWQLGFLETHRRAFLRRVREGRIRDGHGDLRLEHVYFARDGALTILDCIEFADRFRCGDVAADVAFLTMDLAAHGRVDLAERMLSTYARESNDYDLYRVVDFYEAYRAHVRAKIAVIVSNAAEGDVRERALAEARRHFALALSTHRRFVLAPMVIAVGGVIASGKSTVARAIAERRSCPVVDADRTRKHMLGVAPTTHVDAGAFAGAYDPAFTDRVYAELSWRASMVLASGRSVVLDASFRTAEMRRAARDLAREHGVPFLMVECRASEATEKARLTERAKDRGVSDGRLEVFDAFAARGEPMTELGPGEHLVVDTERPLGRTIAAIEERVAVWPAGLTG